VWYTAATGVGVPCHAATRDAKIGDGALSMCHPKTPWGRCWLPCLAVWYTAATGVGVPCHAATRDAKIGDGARGNFVATHCWCVVHVSPKNTMGKVLVTLSGGVIPRPLRGVGVPCHAATRDVKIGDGARGNFVATHCWCVVHVSPKNTMGKVFIILLGG